MDQHEPGMDEVEPASRRIVDTDVVAPDIVRGGRTDAADPSTDTPGPSFINCTTGIFDQEMKCVWCS